MIKFVASVGNDDGLLIGLGLSARNLELLEQGKPIVVDGAEMGLPGQTIMIYYGATEASMVAALKDRIGPETKIATHFDDESQQRH